MVIVGLGNPTDEYRNSRHNAGFIFLERLEQVLVRKGFRSSGWRMDSVFDCEIASLEMSSTTHTLIKPMLYMNRSGEVVAKYFKKKEVSNLSSNLILVHDDLDLKLGEYKIQDGIGPKGHNGVNNVIERLGTGSFKRVRIGIEDRDQSNRIPSDLYVLLRMDEDTLVSLFEAIDRAVDDVISLL